MLCRRRRFYLHLSLRVWSWDLLWEGFGHIPAPSKKAWLHSYVWHHCDHFMECRAPDKVMTGKWLDVRSGWVSGVATPDIASSQSLHLAWLVLMPLLFLSEWKNEGRDAKRVDNDRWYMRSDIVRNKFQSRCHARNHKKDITRACNHSNLESHFILYIL